MCIQTYRGDRRKTVLSQEVDQNWKRQKAERVTSTMRKQRMSNYFGRGRFDHQFIGMAEKGVGKKTGGAVEGDTMQSKTKWKGRREKKKKERRIGKKDGGRIGG